MHYFTPLTRLLMQGEHAIREACEQDDADLDLMEDIQTSIMGRINRSGGPSQPDPTVLLLMNQSVSVWTGAVRMAFSGQGYVVPTILRNALESAAYALLISRTPELAKAWHGRHDGEEGANASRKCFGTAPAKARDLLNEEDEGAGTAMYALYNRLIDDGAHPNPRGVWQQPVTILGGGTPPTTLMESTDWHPRESGVTRKYILDCGYVGTYLLRLIQTTINAPDNLSFENYKRFLRELEQRQQAFNQGA